METIDVGFAIWLFVVSLGASALGGLLGMASGIFIVPILTIFGHLDIRIAIGTSIVSVIACSCGGSAPFLKNQLTNIRLAILLETATTLGAVTGVLLAGQLPASFLYLLFAAILFISAKQMTGRRGELADSKILPPSAWGTKLKLHSGYPDESNEGEIPYQVHSVPFGLSLMYGAGLISALLGIGSGVLKIPAMDTALRLPIKVSSATSNFMIGVTAAASAGAYFVSGDIIAGIAGPVALGSVVGAILGAKILMRVHSEKVRMLFVIVLIALATQMVFQALGTNILKGLRYE